MRHTFTNALAILLLSLAARAQNSDLALLAGLSGPRGQTSTTSGATIVSGTVSPSVQINYAWQVLQRAVDLYVEAPLIASPQVTGITIHGPGVNVAEGSVGPDVFFTPGVRLKVSPESHISFYAAAGFGIASFGAVPTVAAAATILPGSRRNSPALDFGPGVDLRITRLLSFRGEARDFVTRTGLGGVTGRNHGIFQAGIAFHF